MEVTVSGDIVLIRLRGEFDAATSVDQLTVIDHLATTDDLRRVEIDATDVSFIDSTGLRLVLNMVVGVRDSGFTVSTVQASTQFRRLLKVSGLTEIFGLSDAVGPGDAEQGNPLWP